MVQQNQQILFRQEFENRGKGEIEDDEADAEADIQAWQARADQIQGMTQDELALLPTKGMSFILELN